MEMLEEVLWRALVTKLRMQNSGGQFFPSCREKIFSFPSQGEVGKVFAFMLSHCLFF